MTLRGGATFGFDADALAPLRGASDEDLAEVSILGPGGALAWQRLDMHVSVPGSVLDLACQP